MANIYRIRADVFEEWMRRSEIKNYQMLAIRSNGMLSTGTISNARRRGCGLRKIEVIGTALGMTEWRELLHTNDREDLDPQGAPKGAYRIPLCMSHRTSPDVNENYYDSALSSGKSVLYVSIMSRNSFAQFEANLTLKTKVDVLTWNPATTKEIIGFGKHEIRKFPESTTQRAEKLKQVRDALKTWVRLASEHRNIALYAYDSSPTMQGLIVRDEWALIELLPFTTPTQDRPALLLRYKKPSERLAFKFFAERFERLFRSSRRVPIPKS